MSKQTRSQAASALAEVYAYHQGTKHRFQAYAKGPETLDWDAMPAPFRHFSGTSAVVLPRLSEVAPDAALGHTLESPPEQLGCTPSLPLDLATLGALLQLSLGLTAWKSLGPDRWAVRANPSSGNLHPIEAYICIAGIDALEDGLYHYCPEQHQLELRARHPQHKGDPFLGILLTSVMWREAWKYGARAFRYCQLDTGHAVGALSYAARVLGWTLQEQAHVGNELLAALSGVDRLADFPARRSVETEREESEVLLVVGLNGTSVSPVAVEWLQQLASDAQWQGKASTIDPFPMYRWPELTQVALATQALSRPATPRPKLPKVIHGALFPFNAVPGRSIRQLLQDRRSAQRFDPSYSLPLDHLKTLLTALQPVACTPWEVLATAPQLALVLFVSRVEGLEPGIYVYARCDPLEASLRAALAVAGSLVAVASVPGLLRLQPQDERLILAPKPLQRVVRSLHCHQEIAATSCLTLGMLAPFESALASHGPAGYRALFREAGLMGQVLYLQAEALGLRGTGIGCFFDDPVHELLGLEGTLWQSLYHFTVGLPVLDARIESTPAYGDQDPTV